MELGLSQQTLVSLVDWTRLVAHDTEEDMQSFCDYALTPWGPVAGICVYPQWVSWLQRHLKEKLPIISVANFPTGEEPLQQVLASVAQSIEEGASEIDVVVPYLDYHHKQTSERAIRLLSECRKLCGTKVLLKAILETGVLQDKVLIQNAVQDAIHCQVDFIKTSTGTSALGCSLEAVRAIVETKLALNSPVGLKLSGGIAQVKDVEGYFSYLTEVLGWDFMSANTFRVGSSRLLLDMLQRSKDATEFAFS